MPFRPSPGAARPARVLPLVFALLLGLGLVAGVVDQTLFGGGPNLAEADTAAPPALSSQSGPVIKNQYARALAEYYAGKYSRAQVLFSGIRDRVPGNLTDDVNFWRAECAFRLGDLPTAETGFREFLDRGARGPRAEIAVNRLKLLSSWGG
jgi:TolA-binding protein